MRPQLLNSRSFRSLALSLHAPFSSSGVPFNAHLLGFPTLVLQIHLIVYISTDLRRLHHPQDVQTRLAFFIRAVAESQGFTEFLFKVLAELLDAFAGKDAENCALFVVEF